MKLSIVIPAYNVEGYLSKCLDSVISPEPEDYEIIIVDDGSTDGTGAVAAEYARRCPELIRLITTENGGLGHARNTGTDAARGEYLLFLDSDDYLADGALTEIMDTLRSGFDICVFDFEAVNTAGKCVKNGLGCEREGLLSLESYPELLMAAPNAWNKLIRRTLFTSSRIRFPDRAWFEDLSTIPKLYLIAENIVSVRRSWYRYLLRPGSITNSNNTSRNLEIIDALEELTAFYRSMGKYERYEKQFEYMSFYNQFLTSSVRVNLIDRKSSVQDALMEDFIRKYPGYKSNPYVRAAGVKHKLLSFLLMHRQRLAVNLLMRLNNLISRKNA